MDKVLIRNTFNDGIAEVDELLAATLESSGWVRLDLEEKPKTPTRRTRRAAQKPAGDTNTKE